MLHENASARTLGVLRAWVFLMWIADVASCRLAEAVLTPGFGVQGVLRILPRPVWEAILFPEAMYVLQAVTIVVLVPLVLGVGRYRPLAITACVLLTVIQGVLRGWGHLNYRELALLYTTYVLAAFPAADGFSLRRTAARPAPAVMYQMPMILAALVMMLTYCFAGAYRIANNGVAIFLDDTILHYVVMRAAERGPDRALGWWIGQYPAILWTLRIGYPLVTAMELLAPLVLVYRPLRWAWLAVMVPFHFSTGIFMCIWFPHNLALMPLLLTDSQRWLDRLWGRGARTENTSVLAFPPTSAALRRAA